MITSSEFLLQSAGNDPQMTAIAVKVLEGQRINPSEGLILYTKASLPFLALLSEVVRTRLNGDYVYYNRNFHIEPTNICVNHCAFCSYRRRKNEEGCWEMGISEMVEKVKSYQNSGATEVHIVGGVHPDRDLYFYVDLLSEIHEAAPDLQIKAFTAVEIDMMCQMSGLTPFEGLNLLKQAGLISLPGGGAEIFDETLREKICPGKTSSQKWLEIHAAAHSLGIATNATMLYGLLENFEHRIDHLDRLRLLQDQSKGFNAFIPLKFKSYNNQYSQIRESTAIEDLKNYAVSRIFLDNIPHLKAYWPMIGKQLAQLSLGFGVDDLDGTIDDSTKIYSMAGAAEQNPNATTHELIGMIKGAGKIAVERDTLYQILNINS